MTKLPPRVRGYWDGDPYLFCPEQWEEAPFKSPATSKEVEFISSEEVKTLLEKEREKVLEEVGLAFTSKFSPNEKETWERFGNVLESLHNRVAGGIE